MLVLGLMSGTSLDGLDMALCAFKPRGKGFSYSIVQAKTINYPPAWKKKLHAAKDLSAEEYFAFEAQYSHYVAQQVNSFLAGIKKKPAAIASHGHTVFHQPGRGFTTQLGSGAVLAAKTGIATVCDFRSLDVALNGQGAPLVPIGDSFLFGDYSACLNIGGIANISYDKTNKRMAYDICEANMLLNHLAAQCGKPYDKGGKIAASGTVDPALLKKLNGLDYYRKKGARSLGREWFEKSVLPLFAKSSLGINHQLATATAHIGDIIAADLKNNSIHNVLITGGGAFNTHLLACIERSCTTKLMVPPAEVVNFKEALVFAFLGYLRLTEQVNTLASVTGAGKNSIGGAVYLG